MNPPVTCQGPSGITRRNMLQIGAIGALNLGLPQVLAAGQRQAGKKAASKADSCILVFLSGGPSHLDMWDMKPDEPKETRSDFKPIPTSVPGVQLCEHLPKLARLMSHCTLVRSLTHDHLAHAPAVLLALTGQKSPNKGIGVSGAKPTDHPAIGSVLGYRGSPHASSVPYVLMPYHTAEGAGGPPQPGFRGGWLGKAHDPMLVLHATGSADSFNMPALSLGADMTSARMKDRQELLGRLDHGNAGSVSARAMGPFRERAVDLLTSGAAQRAFQIDRERPEVRNAYGRNIYGQSLLLARRLVEAGTRLACVAWAPDANSTWDTHGDNFGRLKNNLLPPFDAAISSLLTDLVDRGMLERTLVVVVGEIGRTPRITNAGRDHWGQCYTALLAGGGLKGGLVHGSSDRHGAYPSNNPVTPGDLIATIYESLGVPPDLELRDRLQRPIPVVTDGSPIRELFA